MLKAFFFAASEAHGHLFRLFDIAKMLIYQVVQGVDPWRNRNGASRHGKIHIRCTTLRRNDRFLAVFTSGVWSERMHAAA